MYRYRRVSLMGGVHVTFAIFRFIVYTEQRNQNLLIKMATIDTMMAVTNRLRKDHCVYTFRSQRAPLLHYVPVTNNCLFLCTYSCILYYIILPLYILIYYASSIFHEVN